MTIYLTRHGKDNNTVRGGWSQYGLTDIGKQEARDLADYIAENQSHLNIKQLFSSDLPRAVETANPIAIALDMELIIMPEFRETNNGVFAGMPHEIADVTYPGLYWNTLEWDEPYPDGESPRIFYERIRSAWMQFSKMVVRNGKNVLLVSHGGVMHVIFSLVDEKPFSNKDSKERIPHATLFPLHYHNNRWLR